MFSPAARQYGYDPALARQLRDEAGVATMRRLADGEQAEVPFEDVVNWLSRTDWAAER